MSRWPIPLTCPPHILRPRSFPLTGNSKLFCERCGKTQEEIEKARAALKQDEENHGK